MGIRIHTTRTLTQPDINLSDEEEVPLATDTTFTTHKSILLDDKDGLREHIGLNQRIADLAKERSTV